jgi:hypothetical protein
MISPSHKIRYRKENGSLLICIYFMELMEHKVMRLFTLERTEGNVGGADWDCDIFETTEELNKSENDIIQKYPNATIELHWGIGKHQQKGLFDSESNVSMNDLKKNVQTFFETLFY